MNKNIIEYIEVFLLVAVIVVPLLLIIFGIIRHSKKFLIWGIVTTMIEITVLYYMFQSINNIQS